MIVVCNLQFISHSILKHLFFYLAMLFTLKQYTLKAMKNADQRAFYFLRFFFVFFFLLGKSWPKKWAKTDKNFILRLIFRLIHKRLQLWSAQWLQLCFKTIYETGLDRKMLMIVLYELTWAPQLHCHGLNFRTGLQVARWAYSTRPL